MKRSFHAQLRAACPRGAWLALALSIAASSCKKPDETKKDAVAEDRAGATPVETKFAKVTEQKVPPRLEVTGTLDPDERSEIASQTAGTVLAVNVDMGSIVKKGDVLVDLDSREAAMRLDVANATAASQRARLGLKGPGKFDAEAVADVKMAKEGADLAKMDFERTKQLYEQGAVSKAQFDAAKSAKERADAGYDAARNGAEQAWVALIASQSQAGLSSKSLDDTKVRAPFDGVVEAKRVAPGEYASPGRVLVVLTSDTTLRFKFEVPEAQSGLLVVGGAIEVRVAAHPDKIFSGQVKRLGASIKAATRTMPVEAEIPNTDRLLKPGFFARGTVQLAGELQPVLLVPKAALVATTGGSRVFVRSGDKVEERLLATGATRGDLVEVTGRLSPGDEIAIENVSALADGVAIAK
ncbi:MAG: efflux RND transporter periplasmic adaptor subunit [Polyangiaceae bacterium]|nr:efflux RND transporter periplasmic adaptor subunit [Polyangiaceae bacterium]MBK8939701.1 efflux RND transporter periplasmic adaptor subunit [Polyangiaceae bacterium]